MVKTEISNNQKELLLLENYDICKILNNTVLGVFIGLISGIGIEAFMNKTNSSGTIWLIICCGLSIIIMIITMGINSHYNKKCYQNIFELENAVDANTKTVKNRVKNNKIIILSYYLLLFLSIFVLGYGLYIFKFENNSIIIHNICPYKQNNIE